MKMKAKARPASSLSLLCLGVASSALLAGCASAPPSYPALDAAHAEVDAARASPDAARYSELQLKKAGDLLQSADLAAQAHKPADVDYYAYMASQTAHLALAIGTERAAEENVAQGEVERQRIQLAARTREAQSATARAEVAEASAKDAQSQAQQAQEQAQQAQSQAQEAEAQRQAADAARQRFQDELASLQAKQTSRGMVITLRDVLFATGKATLQPGAERTLDQLAAALKDAPDRAVQVEGFTDSVGNEDYNQALSERRAEGVRAALLERGVDPARIAARGFGESYPVASNENVAGRQLNRRVEIVVADNSDSVPARMQSNGSSPPRMQ
jgi:outer membrane protein OmpA-like peptidoglycan-associated protein